MVNRRISRELGKCFRHEYLDFKTDILLIKWLCLHEALHDPPPLGFGPFLAACAPHYYPSSYRKRDRWLQHPRDRKGPIALSQRWMPSSKS